jgi:hypothetical protein
MPDNALRKRRSLDQHLQIDTGLVAHFVAQEDEIFCAKVASRALMGRKRAPAETTNRRVEGPDPHFEARTGVGNCHPAGIVKVAGRLLGRSRRARGAVGFTRRGGATRLLFDRVSIEPPASTLRTRLGSRPADWQRAQDIVGGAGLLMLNGREITEWADEQMSAGFESARHPRTMIGVDRENQVWLVTVDGRQPPLSVGMNFAELTRLARRLGLQSALNLDGGGSTTMVLKGNWIVNHPSEAAGPRAVSDAIVVLPASAGRPGG